MRKGQRKGGKEGVREGEQEGWRGRSEGGSGRGREGRRGRERERGREGRRGRERERDGIRVLVASGVTQLNGFPLRGNVFRLNIFHFTYRCEYSEILPGEVAQQSHI